MPSRGSGSVSTSDSLHDPSAISPSVTRFWTSFAVTVDRRKSPWIHPGGAMDQALDGFFALAPFLPRSSFSVFPFVITAVVVEAEPSGARGAEEAEEKRGMGEEHYTNPCAVASYNCPSGSLTCGPARSLCIPVAEEAQYVA